MITARLLKELDLEVVEAVDAATKVMNGEVSTRPRDIRLSGALLVLAAHCESLLARIALCEEQSERDREYIDELHDQLPAESKRLAGRFSTKRRSI